MYCKHCLRELERQPEKAIGDGEVQMVWANPDGNWVCPDTGEEHEAVKGENPIKFTTVDPFLMAGRGEAYFFTYDGEDYYVEDWATNNASGEDLYDADTEKALNHADIFDTDEQIIAFDEALQRAKDMWAELWSDLVAPRIEDARKQFAAEVVA